MASPRRFVAFFDTHIGREKTHIRGEWVTRKTHNPKAIRAALRFMEDYQPHDFVFGGDQLNCGPISHWNHGKPRLVEGFRLRSELDEFGELLLDPVDRILPRRDSRKVWLPGNHEFWIDEHINQFPALEGLVEPENYLRLKQRGWETYGYGEATNLGKLYFTHGDQVLRRGGGSRPAKRLVNAYNRNIRAGHCHIYDVAPQVTPIDSRDVHTGIVVPCLSTRSPEYNKNSPNEFMNGFLFGEIWPDGNFNDWVTVITNNKFSYNGKIYDGNKS